MLFLSGVIVMTLLGLINLPMDIQYHYVSVTQIVVALSPVGFIVVRNLVDL
jgi:hypothetical protein